MVRPSQITCTGLSMRLNTIRRYGYVIRASVGSPSDGVRSRTCTSTASPPLLHPHDAQIVARARARAERDQHRLVARKSIAAPRARGRAWPRGGSRRGAREGRRRPACRGSSMPRSCASGLPPRAGLRGVHTRVDGSSLRRRSARRRPPPRPPEPRSRRRPRAVRGSSYSRTATQIGTRTHPWLAG